MSRGAPPLRFLVLVVGGWVVLRVSLLSPNWWTPSNQPAAAALPAFASAGHNPSSQAPGEGESIPEPSVIAAAAALPPISKASGTRPAARARFAEAQAPPPSPRPEHFFSLPAAGPAARVETRAATLLPALQPPLPRANRWSGSAWLFARDGGSATLAPVGSLGGSQAGGRVLYRLNDDMSRPLALSARVSAPLAALDGAEAAVGFDWKPVAAVPVHVLAERRQALGAQGRSDFALMLHGGVAGQPLAAGLVIDVYAQAGAVGLRRPEPFIDGALRIGTRIERLQIGAGLWGAAQPGLARLDAGPQLSCRLPGKGNFWIAADWRVRVAGEADPGSGPALTLAVDF